MIKDFLNDPLLLTITIGHNLNLKFNCNITQFRWEADFFWCSYLRVHRALSGNARSHGDETSSSWCRVAQCHIECSSVFCLSFVEISFEKCYKALRNRSRQRKKIPALFARPGSYSWQTLSSERSNDRARKLSQCLAKHSWARQKNATNDAKKNNKKTRHASDWQISPHVESKRQSVKLSSFRSSRHVFPSSNQHFQILQAFSS